MSASTVFYIVRWAYNGEKCSTETHVVQSYASPDRATNKLELFSYSESRNADNNKERHYFKRSNFFRSGKV